MYFLAMLRGASVRLMGVFNSPAEASLHILDFAYQSVRGHHHSLNAIITQAAEDAGYIAQVYASKQISKALISSSVLPAFRSDVYWRATDASSLERRGAAIFVRTCMDLLFLPLQGLCNSKSVILVHTTTPWHLQALLTVLGAARSKSRINIFFMLPPDYHATQELLVQQQAAYLEAGKISVKQALHIRYFVENELLAKVYRNLGFPNLICAHLPAKNLPENYNSHSGSACDMPCFLFIGEPRPEKGFQLIMDALEIASQRSLGLQFRMRLSWLGAEHRAILESYDWALLDLEVYEGGIPDDLYFDSIRTADAVLLPYNPIAYRTKNSNIVSECLICGTPVVVTGGNNSLQAYVDSLQAECFVSISEYSSEGLLSAMQQCSVRLPQLKQEASNLAESISAARSPETFIEMLMQDW